tara:strand:+ start:115 stop:600 length:486 start_codon:yes stop_codon:yes gene_type:complete
MMMKKIAALTVLVIGTFVSVAFSNQANNPSKDKLLIEIVSYVLSRGHFSPSEINDAFSENVYMNYLNGIDGRHQFFIKADISNFNAYKKELDDEIKASKVDFFNLTHSKFLQRLEQVKSFYPSLLEQPFDFSVKEKINVNYEKVPHAASLSELKNVCPVLG